MSAFDRLRAGQAKSGYYGSHTSTIDWCEVNYQTSMYICEWNNSLSNLPVILMGLWGCFASLRGGLRRRYAFGYLGLVFIGFGSLGFHTTLMWEWQLLDELPMIYFVSYTAFLLVDDAQGFGVVPLQALVLIVWDALFAVAYLLQPNPVYHEVAFGIIIGFCFIKSLTLVRRLGSSRANKTAMLQTLSWAAATFLTGFSLWNIDNLYCDELRRWREVMGPLGFLLEGHAYWHLLSAYGAYLGYTFCTYLIVTIKTSPDTFQCDNSGFPTCNRVASKGTVHLPSDKL